MRPIVGSQFRQNILNSALDRLFTDRQMRCNLLIRVAGRDQTKHSDLSRRQSLIGQMLAISRDASGERVFLP